MSYAPPGSGFWFELSFTGKLVTQAALVTAILASLALVTISTTRLTRPLLRYLWPWLRWQAHHRAAHRFAAEVAAGNLDEADRAVARVLAARASATAFSTAFRRSMRKRAGRGRLRRRR